MNKKSIVLILVFVTLFILILGGYLKHRRQKTNYSPQSPSSQSFTSRSLRQLADKQNFEIGSALGGPNRLNDLIYLNVLTREFNLLEIDGSPLNWGLGQPQLRPDRTSYNFTDADNIVKFAQDHNMIIQAHHLTWGSMISIPSWLKQTNFSKADLLSILHDHIQTVMGRYKGKIKEWTVANEVVSRGITHKEFGSGKYTDDFWYKQLGQEYIEQAFIWAKQADPNATLILSDYNNEVMNETSNALYSLVQNLKSKNIPVDGIGMQMHLIGNNPPSER